VLASWDRIIRTTVGLRPHRPAGFNVGVAKLDDKTVIHNYGHGGAGHSLGWGTGLLAAELALGQSDRRAAVIGCGTVGLTAARQLQRRGFEVTIYTRAVPPDTTSNMALAAFTPTSGLLSAEASPEFTAQFRRAVDVAYRQLQLFAGRDYGISWIDSFNTTDSPDAAGRNTNPSAPITNFRGSDMDELLPPGVDESIGRIVLGPGEHPFPSRYAIWRRQLRIEPSIYLDALVRDFLLFGGRVVIRAFDTPRDLMTLDQNLIVNCTGLGARTLFGDETMFPVKGQLTVLIPQPEINYSCRAMPRSDGIALGTTQERAVATLEPNLEAQQRIVDACIKFYSAMHPIGRDTVVFQGRPLARLDLPRDVPPVESFFGLES
jgi:glycine/D-amino acid oxidase-like deaminating enzyme